MSAWWLLFACQTPHDSGKVQDTSTDSVILDTTDSANIILLPPTLQFIRPLDGDHLNSGSTNIQLLLTDPDSTVAQVDCDASGGSVHQDLHNVGAVSFTVTLKVGLQTLHCVARDPDGLTGDSSIAIDVVEVDLDGDGYGSSVDCDDTNAWIHPVNADYCNGIDDDCDGATDEDEAKIYYQDLDGDGFGEDATSILSCAPTEVGVWVLESGDCNHGDATIFPGASEWCDAIDNDCDGVVDEDAVDALPWYTDLDTDGYGDTSTEKYVCDQPTGMVETAGDCDDHAAAISPAAVEVCDGVDNDCGGTIHENAIDATAWYDDLDGDGYGDSTTALWSCTMPAGTSVADGDCDDQDNRAAPNLPEVCDSLDNNCDNAVDEDTATDVVLWYEDLDGDNYGNAAVTTVACDQPAGYVTDATDCDDSDSLILDASSTGTLTYPDADGDWYGTTGLVCDTQKATVTITVKP